jgi:ribulose-phosphate 3-epimerase
LAEVDLVLIAAVNPGFGGQELIPAMIAKIARLREWLDARAPHVELEVDGGLNSNTITEVAGAGATVLVVGSAVFNDQGSIAKNIYTLRFLSGKHSK